MNAVSGIQPFCEKNVSATNINKVKFLRWQRYLNMVNAKHSGLDNTVTGFLVRHVQELKLNFLYCQRALSNCQRTSVKLNTYSAKDVLLFTLFVYSRATYIGCEQLCVDCTFFMMGVRQMNRAGIK